MRNIQRETTWLWLIIIVGALVRFYRLDFQSLWLDEGWQYAIASADSMSGVFGRVLGPNPAHPPLSYLINHLFLQVQDSDFFLRLPSVLFGIGSLPLCYILARRFASAPAAVFAVWVFALAPFHIWYSQEARMYAQLICLSLLSTIFLLNALERTHTKWWVFYTLTVTAGMYTHIFMALSVIAQGLWTVFYHRDHLLSYSMSVAMAGTFFCVPLSHFLLESYRTFNRPPDGAGFSWASLPYTFFVYAAGFSLGPSVVELHEDRSLSFIVQFLPSILAVGIVFGTLFISGIVSSYKRLDTKYINLCVLSFCIPLLGVLIFSLGPRFTFNVRYTAVSFPYFCIFIGIALSFFYRRNRLTGMLLLACIFCISYLSLHNYFLNTRYAKEDIRSAVKFFQEISKDEKLLSYSEAYTVNRYLPKSEKYRHFPIQELPNTFDDINKFISINKISQVYLLLARDWNKVAEKEIYNAFSICNEKEFNGVKLFKICLE